MEGHRLPEHFDYKLSQTSTTLINIIFSITITYRERERLHCDKALREFLFWEATKVVLHANAKLLIQCLAYCTCLARAIKGYSGLEKFRSQQVILEMQGKKSNFVHEIEIRKKYRHQ